MPTQTADQAKQIVDKALASIGDIATLPEVTIKIIEIVEDARSTARDLHEVIKTDPALSVKVLRLLTLSLVRKSNSKIIKENRNEKT